MGSGYRVLRCALPRVPCVILQEASELLKAVVMGQLPASIRSPGWRQLTIWTGNDERMHSRNREKGIYSINIQEVKSTRVGDLAGGERKQDL